MTKLEEAAQSLRKQLGDDRSFIIGIAAKGEYNPEDHIVIYLRDKKTNKKYPESFEGFRVEVRYMSKIEIKRSKDGGI